MSFQAMTWAIRLKLPTREKFVLLMLANYASNERGDCYPSLSRLADDTGMSKVTVIEALRALEAMGAVAICRRSTDGVNLPNTYRLNLTWEVGGSAAEPVVRQMNGGGSPAEPKPINEPINKKKEVRARVTFNEFSCRLDIPPTILQRLTDAYPGVAVAQEIAKAESWLAVNPTRRPKRDFGRFLNGWLSRAARAPRQTKTKAERQLAFMEGIFGPTQDNHVIDVTSTVVN